MNLQQLNELDFNNIGEWPLGVKLVMVLLVAGLVIGGGYFLHIQEQQTRLAQQVNREDDLRSEFESKSAKALNLDGYLAQLAEMQDSFGAMLRQLPDRTEVADLLVDVSQTGLAAGLEFKLFRPMGETPKDFYAELPIQLRVEGTYHEFGQFISGLAALPRIVTIHNVSTRPLGNDARLVMEATAKTYRYLEEGGS